MTQPGTNHHRPTNHNRSKTAPAGGGVRPRKNGFHHHHNQEKVDAQNNVLKKPEDASNTDWDINIPIPKLSVRNSSFLVASLSLLCYLNSCYGDFVFDDTEAVLSNKDVKPETPIIEVLQDDFWGERITKNHSHKSYRPLTVLSFRLNYILSGGFHPFSFHLTNVVLHTIISVFSLRIFSILLSDLSCLHRRLEAEKFRRKTFPAPRASLLCALLFTAHPIHTESVAGVVGRADLLSAAFFFLSFFFYVSALQKDGGHFLLSLLYSILCCTASMLCKEQGITVIGVCIVYDVILNCQVDMLRIFQRSQIPTKSQGSSHPRWLPSLATRLSIMTLCAVVLLAGRFFIMGSGPPPFQPSDNPASFADGILTRVTNYNFIYALNLWLLIFPRWLCFDWSMGCVSLIQSANDIRLLAPVALWVLLGGLIYRSVVGPPSHGKRVLTMALALLIIPFLPASNLFLRVGFVIAERVLYLPSLGFCMLLTLMVDAVSRSSVSKKAVQCLLVILLAYYVGRCIQRNQDWMTEERLYKAGLDVCPRNAKVHYNIGKNAADSGSLDEAVTYYRQALSLNPVYDQAMNNLANLLKDQGHLTEAEELLHKAVQIKPQFAAAWMNLGIVQAANKKYTEAEQSYKMALSHRHRYADCYFNLGNMYLELRRDNEALGAWLNATSFQSDHARAWSNAVVHFESLGQYETAILVAKEAMKHVPQEPSIYFGLGNVLGKEGRYQEAEENFLQAIQLNPKMANYHGNLGVLYHRWGKYSKAKKHYTSALELDPESRNARNNLKKLQQTMTKMKSKKNAGQ
ncbi:protein O-mannosyl-transferase TMTC4-like isoform X1 [Patiria miniata]|uniref:dolichyl-phosphate-mannose--protein mannosyltransferase n=1 Tax=Patiria miniata TaxID=46514 RepID=A0A913ZEU3_PATMI|nr:protein O-mannosyl-transferase TMTC4-like isoform X1 [Patiria miniata]XP_038050308.1 protein O-mannosyl-transferase TMTC4-like isoform X1 [Patiria miniata]XP_038050309.1 protein O-mannosyl-transferase TMTC4-like isoform X1 [Patiria miniata]